MSRGEDGERRPGAGESAHVDALLDRYRTDELAEPERRPVAAHLETCARCRAALEDLERFAATVARGYAVEREAAAGREPDWARLQAGVLARTSAREPGRRRGWLARYAPQAAAAVLAILAVGIVLEQGVRRPADAERAVRSLDELAPALRREAEEPAEDAPGSREPAGPEREPVEDEFRADVGAPDRAEGVAPAGARDGRGQAAEAAVGRAAKEAPAAALEDRAAAPPRENREAVVGQAVEADRAGGRPAAPAAPEDDQAAIELEEAAVAKADAAAGLERFESRAREALASRDSALALGAYAQWRDSLATELEAAPPEVRRELRALADSLAALIALRP